MLAAISDTVTPADVDQLLRQVFVCVVGLVGPVVEEAADVGPDVGPDVGLT